MNQVLALLVGAGLGLIHFGGLWVTVRHCLRPEAGASATRTRYLASRLLSSWFVRLAVCAVVFWALCQEGVVAVLLGMGGFWLARCYLQASLGGGRRRTDCQSVLRRVVN
jgi:F1F0 ATPase subunit 2